MIITSLSKTKEKGRKSGKREWKRRKKKKRERKRRKRCFLLTQDNKPNLFGEKKKHIFSPGGKNIIYF